VTVVVGTHTFAASGEAARRQARAIDALRALNGVTAENVQFARDGHTMDGVHTIAALTRDSCSVTGSAGPRKAIVSDILDVLCTRAEAVDSRYFCFMNADIVLSQVAVDWIATGNREAWLFSREDFDGATGVSLGMATAGMDAIALSTAWWRRNRHRFRPYIAGEAVWDNVYTAIVMCHADAALENRHPLVRHEAHPAGWAPGQGPFARYTQYLAARDASYFTLWCQYWDGLQAIRRRGDDPEAEEALARRVFAWRPTTADRVRQTLRNVKAELRYRVAKFAAAE
jgi:hypothetical protein